MSRSVLTSEPINFGIPPITLGNGKFLEEAWQPQIEDRVAFPADLVAQGPGEPGFANVYIPRMSATQSMGRLALGHFV